MTHQLAALEEQRTERLQFLEAEVARLTALLNTPELEDFAKGVVSEAQHQRARWGSEHDAGKTASDWYWLVAYLATKAHQAIVYGDSAKALHHLITTAAALANWHAHIAGVDTSMRPGVAEPTVSP
jgi:hypothetical protein